MRGGLYVCAVGWAGMVRVVLLARVQCTFLGELTPFTWIDVLG